MKSIIKDSLILFAITIIAGGLLGFVYKITKEPIAAQNEKIKIAAYNSVFSDLADYEDIEDLSGARTAMESEAYSIVTLDEAVVAKDSQGKVLGLIITVTEPEGYGGNIKMTVGVDTAGAITGLEILDISETAGLGMKAKDASFRGQFVGKAVDTIGYVKNSDNKTDSDIDAISSATITTKAVTKGVNGALSAYRALIGGVLGE